MKQVPVELGIHVALLVCVLVESLLSNMLVGPDLAKPVRVALRASAPEIAHRDALEVDVHGVIGAVHLLPASIPLLAVGFVAHASRRRGLAEDAKRGVLAHDSGIVT